MNSAEILHFYSSLTRRQQEIVQLVSEGCSNREIARILCIEPCVVAGHLTNIYDLAQISLADDPTRRPNRLFLIRHFTLFFVQYPELKTIPDETAV